MRAGVLVLGLLIATVALAESGSVSSSQWSAAFDTHFRKYSKRYFGPHFDWRWFKAQGIAESGLDPKVKSEVGAVGVMQILPSTFSEIRKANPHFTRIDDPKWNIAAGIFYDRQLFRKWRKPLPGNERLFLTFAGYNAGYGGVLRAIKRTGKDQPAWDEVKSHLPGQTRHYVRKIAALMEEGKRPRGVRKYLTGL